MFAHIAKYVDCESGMHFKPDRRKRVYECGGYVKKFTSAHCSSHIIEESILLQTVKDDLGVL
ncbi:recombinase zinc beta ribbon domain-containing protein [Bacillus altitudinis]|uniref:recombinase zinc beta ribbon domain-containing protein n=1 Tax=Bacillus altitudinis TaxID=293387 RepID=UPI000AE3113B